MHINGIGTTAREAAYNEAKLEEISKISTGRNYLTWGVVYNPTAETVTYADGSVDINREFFTNVWDVIQQKNKELELDNMMTLDNYLDGLLTDQVTTEAREVLLDMVRPDYQNLIKEYSGKNIDDIIDNYHKAVPAQFASVVQELRLHNNLGENYQQEPISVLLLPHSQGNLYANELYEYLTLSEGMDPKHIAIFGVGSPAERNLGEWPLQYSKSAMINQLRNTINSSNQLSGAITDCSDKVINSLRTMENIKRVLSPFSVVLPSWAQVNEITSCNYQGQSEGSDFLNHNLIKHYLNDANKPLQDIIALNINYYVYVLNYVLMEDLTNNLMPLDSGYNKYRQAIAFVIGDVGKNNAQTLFGYRAGGNYTWIWGDGNYYDYDFNPSGLLYVKQPLFSNINQGSLMSFYAAPSDTIVEDGYYIRDPVQLFEDTDAYKNNNEKFYIYPAGGNYTKDIWANSFFVLAYPWNKEQWMPPWADGANGTCVLEGMPYSVVPRVGNTFANLDFGIPVLAGNPWISDINKCFSMPPSKTDRYILNGWYHNLK